jgi:phosphatidylserine/phosphatidylglycerophosphate/cardiolipin synthase-like enzyme
MTKNIKQEFVAGEQVWPTLQRLARRTSGSNRIASAYLGDRAGHYLRLGEGDILVVDLSEANAKNGIVSPREISRLIERGVQVFMADKLHAKVYLLGDVLAVGSANLSSNSFSALEEALLVSRDPAGGPRCRPMVRAAMFDTGHARVAGLLHERVQAPASKTNCGPTCRGGPMVVGRRVRDRPPARRARRP